MTDEQEDRSTARERFLHQLRQNIEKDMDIVEAKNSDYAQGFDPFQNFRMVEDAGLMTVEQGIAVRMSDKLQRIFNLLDKDADVDDETLEDTLSDLRNYANILQVYLNWDEGQKKDGIAEVMCDNCHKPARKCICGEVETGDVY